MDLNKYQEAALERFDRWRETLAGKRAESEKLVTLLKQHGHDVPDAGNYPKKAWDAMADKKDVADSEYVDRSDGAGRPIPHVCFKIPTGGGKTLVAAAVLERLGLRTGLVIWVVPTKRIYAQTKSAIKRRDGPIRQRLDHGSGGRVKFMEKDDAFNRYDAEQFLCVMPLMLAAVNRKENKDFLRINQDSGAYRSFFQDADVEPVKDSILKNHPDLERHPNGVIKHSLANVLKMMRPVVILDEAHKAYGRSGQEYVGMINHLNPSLVVEMSATPSPHISNLLVDVSGNDLWEEDMIKMPINLSTQTYPDWKRLLDTVHIKLGRLEADAKLLQSKTGRYVRPIALVRVERTGKEQRDGRHIHAEDAREYLMTGLAVPPNHIAVQSSSQQELNGIDLMSEAAQIRWIITKDAIKEGWDCPFAYALAILDNIKTHTSVTQLLGRVLRQPGAHRTEVGGLDQCYVYCHSSDTAAMADYVRKGLSDAGMGDMGRMVSVNSTRETAEKIEKRQRLPGRIFLPLVLHKRGKDWTALEYERHILSGVDFAVVDAPDPANFRPSQQGSYSITIRPDGSRSDSSTLETHEAKTVGVEDFARPLSDIVPNIWQAARIAQDFMERLHESGNTRADIYNGLPYLKGELCRGVAEAVNRQAKSVFCDKVRRGDIRFDLEIDDMNYLISNYDVAQGTLLQRNSGGPVQRTLFDPIYEEEFDTDFERSFAKYLDAKEIVDWWHRVAARQRDGYHLVGWKRSRIYPDFIVMTNEAGNMARLGIYDTKGGHLDSNQDAEYKSEVLKALEDAFNCGTVRVRGRMHGEFRLVLEGRFEEILT